MINKGGKMNTLKVILFSMVFSLSIYGIKTLPSGIFACDLDTTAHTASNCRISYRLGTTDDPRIGETQRFTKVLTLGGAKQATLDTFMDGELTTLKTEEGVP